MSSNSILQIIRSSESSSNENILSPLRSILISFKMWIDFSRQPCDISSGNNGVGQYFISSGLSGRIADCPSVTDVDVVFDGDSTLDLTSLGV